MKTEDVDQITIDEIDSWVEDLKKCDQEILKSILEQLKYSLDSQIDGINLITSKLIALQAMSVAMLVASLVVCITVAVSLPDPAQAIPLIPLFLLGFYCSFMVRKISSILDPIPLYSSGEIWEDYRDILKWNKDGDIESNLLSLIRNYAIKQEGTKKDALKIAINYPRFRKKFIRVLERVFWLTLILLSIIWVLRMICIFPDTGWLVGWIGWVV